MAVSILQLSLPLNSTMIAASLSVVPVQKKILQITNLLSLNFRLPLICPFLLSVL